MERSRSNGWLIPKRIKRNSSTGSTELKGNSMRSRKPWRVTMTAPEFHENGNGLDNRRENLRGVGKAD
jgi:hypothetical protein